MKTLIPIILVLSCLICEVLGQSGQDTLRVSRNEALKIYLDCDYCDFDYFRTNFTEVNYMQERQEADVHIMVSDLGTGSGGSQFHVIYKGLKRFAALRDTLVFEVPGKATEEEIRSVMLENVQLGLVPYLVKTPSKNRMSLFFSDSPTVIEESDPWKNWMFELSGEGSFFKTGYSQDLSLSGSLFISKISPEIKVESSNSFYYSDSRFWMYDSDKKDSVSYRFNSIQRSFASYNLFVKSLGEHVGLGAYGRYRKSIYSNYNHQVHVGPSVEVNLFKYSDASNRQFRIRYSLLYEHATYDTLTVNDKWRDDFLSNEVQVNFSIYETWGTVNSTLWASCYLNDTDQYSYGLSASASINLGKGLSFYTTLGFSVVQNQVNLPKDPANFPGSITGQREMYSEFNYRVGFGIAYRFGSIFNNAVNPRFDY